MRSLKLLACFLIITTAHAQRPVQISNKGQFQFNSGFEPLVVDSILYFSAFSNNNGWQAYSFDGDGIRTISGFSTKYQEKNREESECGGGVLSQLARFNHSLVAHVSGKTVENGIYRVEDGRLVRLVNKVERCSPPVEVNGDLYVEGVVTEGDVEYKRAIVIHSDWTSTRGGKTRLTKSGIATEACVLGISVFGSLDGKLARWGDDGFAVMQSDYIHVQNLFTFENRLFFSAIKSGDQQMQLHSFDIDGNFISHGNIFPGQNMLNPHDVLVTPDAAYFVADPDKKGLRMYKLGNDSIEEIVIMAAKSGFRDFQGMAFLRNQVFVCVSGVRGPVYDLFQYDGKTYLERNPEYFQNIRGVTVLKDKIVFLATELGNEAIYISEPVLPPQIENDTFKIYDFYRNGDVVGTVQATDPTGRIRYHIISGDDNKTFEIDYFNGEIRVSDRNGVRNHTDQPYYLTVKAENRDGASSNAVIVVNIHKAKVMDTKGLRETLMFFPVLSKRHTLSTKKIANGQTVQVFNDDFQMVDELVVKNKEIVIGEYPIGIYFLNVHNGENLYQKMVIE
ncbi:MAG: hypothetical protein GC181_01180 [Bacteroidetes bacterium]|nr:hypothetical protein [Bacteroidota bacterium]